MKKNKLVILILLLQSTISLLSCDLPDICQAARQNNLEAIKKHLENHENCAIKDQHGNNALHYAAESGHDEAIKLLTGYYDNCSYVYWLCSFLSGPTLPSIDEKNNNGDTPLHRAVEEGHVITAGTLLKKNADKEIRNKQELSAAFAAIKKDNPALLRAMIYNGLDPRTHKKGNIPMLHYAMENQKNSVVAYFAANQTLLDQSGPNGIKPIHVAAKSDNIIGLNLVLRNNTDAINATDDNGNTVAHYSAIYGTQEIMRELLEHRADLKKRNNNGDDATTLAIKYKKNNISDFLLSRSSVNINTQDPCGRTYAMNAAISGNNEFLATLLNRGADLTIADQHKKNILHIIGSTNNYDGAQLVLENNKSLLSIADKDGNQPLFNAMSSDNPNMALLYITHGAPLSTRNNSGETPVFFAVKHNQGEILDEMHKRNVDFQLTNKAGESLVHYAGYFNAVNALKKLNGYGVSFFQRSQEGNTPIHSAAKNGSLDALRYFQSIGELHEYYNNQGETPFIVAGINGQLEAIQFLFSEEKFINKQVDSLLNKLRNTYNYDQKKVYNFIKEKHDERIAECQKIHYEYVNAIEINRENQRSIAVIAEKNPVIGLVDLWFYDSTEPEHRSADQIYEMTREQRTALYNHYLECKNKELTAKIHLGNQLNAIRLEEERMRQEQLTAVRAQKEELQRIAAERERVRQERHTAALENQHLPAFPQQTYVPQDLQPSAPPMDDEANNAQTLVAECCICFEQLPTIMIPCKNKHTDTICRGCLAQLKTCPLCRAAL
jgi:ankyrin repeat protein